ncbi:MAG: hypothetical protein HOP12_16245 [Candidatus Eisenbacteria bacterium]|uniref:Thioredoxin domain-containing protein n=1 Tax=Eiseniibacteriota bacterium TaxID=2212470 RepID=A0A849SJW4_UNCEI|nr:hypothetical protein [Candidatus Eisenbacteria bacterium]
MRLLTRSLRVSVVAALTLSLSGARPAAATQGPGQVITDFARAELVGSAPGPVRTLADYPNRIIVMFQFGYNCPVCLNDGPGFQTEIAAYYGSVAPNDVQVLGADMWNGTPAQVASIFRNTTGATFPLLLTAGTAANGNLNDWGPWDNYVIVDRGGIVRFNAAVQGYAHGSRLDVPRMKALIDSLVALAPVGVPAPGSRPNVARLTVAPNPFNGVTRLEFAHAAASPRSLEARVYDTAGREVARLAPSTSVSGASRFEWNGKRTDGREVAAGIYLVRAMADGVVAHARVVKVR